jgi:hypothetical protein
VCQSLILFMAEGCSRVNDHPVYPLIHLWTLPCVHILAVVNEAVVSINI